MNSIVHGQERAVDSEGGMPFRFVLSALVVVGCFFGPPISLSAPEEARLWPSGAEGLRHEREETVEDKRETGRRDRWIGLVSDPTLTIYPAAKTGSLPNPAILVIPGGGFRFVCIDKEGVEAVQWLNSIGVTAAVLKYRTLDVSTPREPPWLNPIFADGKRAMRLLRARATEWNIDPARIGAMGFSAGGTIAAMTVADGGLGDPNAADPIDRLACGPQFLILVYSGFPPLPLITYKKPFPPVFLVHAADDPKAPVDKTIKVFQFLQERGGTAELHVFRKGGHGFGMHPEAEETRVWPQLCAGWLRGLEMLPRAAP